MLERMPVGGECHEKNSSDSTISFFLDAFCIGLEFVQLIEDMKADFLATLGQSQIVILEQAKLRGWQRLLAELMKVFSPLL